MTTGAYNDSPILNSVVYDVEFPDGEVFSSRFRSFTLTLMDSILDIKKDASVVSKDELYTTTKRGGSRMRQTTCGWKFLVLWKDGSEQWVPLHLWIGFGVKFLSNCESEFLENVSWGNLVKNRFLF